MYLVYSLLTLLIFVVVSPYFVYQAIRYKKYIASMRELLGYLPISFNLDAEESIWIHAVSVGEALTARALAADLKARYPRLRLFLSTTTILGQQVAKASLAASTPFSLPVRLVHRAAHAELVLPPHHDERRRLAQPAPGMPQARREDRHDNGRISSRSSALPADPSVFPPRAGRHRSVLRAERGVGASPDRSGRRAVASR
jgi:hypothetical protein